MASPPSASTTATGAGHELVGYGSGSREATLPAPPTQARGVEKRDRIYQAAISQYESDGIAATRVEDVIADADVSWATFFRYFPRKEDVLVELAARHFHAHVRAPVAAWLSGGTISGRAFIERTFETLLAPNGVSPALHSAAILEVFANPPRFAALVDDGHPQPVVGLVAELLAEAQRRGELRADLNPEATALTVVAGSLFPGAQAAASGLDPSLPIAVALDLLWEGCGTRS